MDLLLEAERIGNVVALRAIGEIDASTAPRLDLALAGLYAEGHTRVIVDVTRVPTIDAEGAEVLRRWARRLSELGGGLVAVATAWPVARALGQAGVDSVATLAEARQRLAPG